MEKALATIRGGHVGLDAPVDWPDGTRLEVRPVDLPGNGAPAPPEAPPGVREEFLAAMNDPDRFGLDESLWPRTAEERAIWLNWFESTERSSSPLRRKPLWKLTARRPRIFRSNSRLRTGRNWRLCLNETLPARYGRGQ